MALLDPIEIRCKKPGLSGVFSFLEFKKMVASLSGVFGPGAKRSHAQRLEALKGRTLLVFLIGLACFFIGGVLVSKGLAELSAWCYAFVMGRGGLPLPHVPAWGDNSRIYAMLQTTLLCVWGIGIIGFSLGSFGRRSMTNILVPLLLITLASALFIPATSHWMLLMPSKMERSIMYNRLGQIDEGLTSAPKPIADYAQAQIALRLHDEPALRKYGQAVLQLVDTWTYDSASLDPTLYGGESDPGPVRFFRPEVVYALDLALNGAPETEVGIRWQQEQNKRGPFKRWLSAILGLVLLASSAPPFKLWNIMRRRVRIVSGALAQELHADRTGRRIDPGTGLINSSMTNPPASSA